MRRARHLLWALALAALAAAPAANATSVTVQISGTWSSVADNASVLDGSISVGGAFAASLVYDDSVLDADPTSGFGAYFTPAASSDLSVVSGNYTFTPGSAVGVGVENNNEFGEDVIRLMASNYSAAGPLPAGVSSLPTALSRVNASLTDSSGTALSSEALAGLNWSLADYDASDFYLFVQIAGRGSGKFIEFAGTISNVTVLPEPSTLIFATAALASLAFARGRG